MAIPLPRIDTASGAGTPSALEVRVEWSGVVHQQSIQLRSIARIRRAPQIPTVAMENITHRSAAQSGVGPCHDAHMQVPAMA